MPKLTPRAEDAMHERFGGDSVIALATAQDGKPHVRYVNATYDDGAFYVITHALSGKMSQIAANPAVAIAGDWFTANGRAHSMGWVGLPANAARLDMLKQAFAEWIDNGHTDLDDHNTIILRIDLTDGLLLRHGERFELDFT